MRILIYNWRDISHPLAGGAEVYTHEIAKQWVAQGHEVTLFCSRYPEASKESSIDGVRIVRRGSRYSVYWHATQFYRREGRNNFDIVVDEGNTRPFHAHRYVKDTPVVMLVHQLAREIWFHEFPWPAAIIGRYLLEPYWVLKCRAANVVAVSQSTAESLFDHGVKNVSIVGEGMSLPPYATRHDKETVPTVIFCGRLATNKRPDHAIRAFETVRSAVPNARMWVIGTGPMQKHLEKIAPDGVEFLGRVSDEEKFERMARAHMLVATSVREGWGLVVSEAAAVGTACVGYDVPGLRDSIPASDGVLTAANPHDLGAAMAAQLPEWSSIPTSVNAGGVRDWRSVANDILAAGGVVDVRERVDIREQNMSQRMEG